MIGQVEENRETLDETMNQGNGNTGRQNPETRLEFLARMYEARKAERSSEEAEVEDVGIAEE